MGTNQRIVTLLPLMKKLIKNILNSYADLSKFILIFMKSIMYSSMKVYNNWT